MYAKTVAGLQLHFRNVLKFVVGMVDIYICLCIFTTVYIFIDIEIKFAMTSNAFQV